jgi:hypothetical protein
MKLKIALALILILIADVAWAQKKFVALTKPNWVYQGASTDLDFVDGLYYSKGFIGDPNKWLVTTRTSTGTSLLSISAAGASYITYPVNSARVIAGYGLLGEPTRTNYALNSSNPAPGTYTTASIGFAQAVTLWINAAAGGSVTMGSGTATGCGTGVATQGNPVVFTLSVIGTCTWTVAGTVYAVQIEQGTSGQYSGSPTSYVPTGGSTAFRIAESVAYGTTGVDPWLLAQSGTGTLLCEYVRPHPPMYDGCFGPSSGTVDVFIGTNSAGGNFQSVSHDNTIIAATDGGPSNPNVDKVAISWDGTGRCLVWNNGTPVCDAKIFTITSAQTMVLAQANGRNGPMRRVTFWPSKLSTAALGKLTK